MFMLHIGMSATMKKMLLGGQSVREDIIAVNDLDSGMAKLNLMNHPYYIQNKSKTLISPVNCFDSIQIGL